MPAATGQDTSAAVRWSALLGATLVLALWFVNGIA
jgi:hypothetical protein